MVLFVFDSVQYQKMSLDQVRGRIGCMDCSSPTYDPTANVHQQSACATARYGCMDARFLNYNANANVTFPGACQNGPLFPLATRLPCPQIGGRDLQVQQQTWVAWPHRTSQ